MLDSTREAYRLAALAEANAARARQEAWHRVTRSKEYRDASSDVQEARIEKVAADLIESAVAIAKRAEGVAETKQARDAAREAVAYCESMR